MVEDTKVTPPQPTPPPEKTAPSVTHKEASGNVTGTWVECHVCLLPGFALLIEVRTWILYRWCCKVVKEESFSVETSL